MTGRQFKPKLAPSSAPHSFDPSSRYAHIVKTLFSQNAIILGVALFQLLFCVLLPDDFAIVPAAVLLLSYALSTLFHLSRPSKPLRPRARIARPRRLQPRRADQPPLGWLCPGGHETSSRFLAMHAELHRARAQHGLVAANVWRGYAADNASAIVVTYYFRDVQALHRFAHGPLHRGAWDWYAQGRYKHIGVFHETFVVPPRAYETVYVNCSPVGLGAGSVRCDDGGGDGEGDGKGGEGLSAGADMPALKTQMARLGRDDQGNEKL
ncbi:hypothetical protein ACCO45_008090 [Purpureocillium lilacinum]|uniref:Uncharacterized protein n=1 Tax=Purpureocillium lilacinum TaxID=33203 RepID=A0ACC4DNU5_PURLI